jgi:predicted DCC family thiol-disulfide oxidoreductase YuxK
MSDAVFVYDDDCGFCTWWAEFVAERSHLPIVGFSALSSDLRDRLPEDYEQCSHLVTDETVYSCGASIEEALLRTDLGAVPRPVVERLRSFRTYQRAREWGYRRGANNRSLWGRLLSKTPPARRHGEGGDR